MVGWREETRGVGRYAERQAPPTPSEVGRQMFDPLVVLPCLVYLAVDLTLEFIKEIKEFLVQR